METNNNEKSVTENFGINESQNTNTFLYRVYNTKDQSVKQRKILNERMWLWKSVKDKPNKSPSTTKLIEKRYHSMMDWMESGYVEFKHKQNLKEDDIILGKVKEEDTNVSLNDITMFNKQFIN